MKPALNGLYIVRLDLDAPHAMGVAKKVRAQASALAASLGDIDLLYPSGGKVMCNGQVLRDYGDGPLWRRLVGLFLFYTALVSARFSCDFVYIRYQRTSPVFLWMLSRLRARNPDVVILVELPSFPYHTENITLRDKVLGLSDQLFRTFLRQDVDRIVTFSQAREILGVPTIRTDNGVDVDGIPVQQASPDTGEIRLLGLANLSFWHGYDRVISGLARYRAAGGRRRVTFEIVGSGRELERLKADTRTFGLEDVVTFHGPMQGGALEGVVQGCHIGISSIGMHRLDVDTSNLKSREFCARGLPFVIAYADRDFGADFPFAYEASMTDDPVDIEALLAFHDRLKAEHPDYPAKMRAYADARLTWKGKMAPVVDAIVDLVPVKD